MGQNELSEPSEIVKNDNSFDFLGVKSANIQWKIFQVVFSGSGHLTRMELVAMVAVLLMVVPGSGGDPAMPHQNANASPGW